MNNLAQRVRSVRARLGMSQADFAKRLKYSRGTISNIENGKNTKPDDVFFERFLPIEQHGLSDVIPSAHHGLVREDGPMYGQPARGRLMSHPPPPQNEIIATMERLLRGFESLSPAHQASVAMSVATLAGELVSSVEALSDSKK